jgi:hypothetical protein
VSILLELPAWPINQDTPEPKPELIAEPIRELEAEALREPLERLISEDKAFEVPELRSLAAACMQTGDEAPPSHPRSSQFSGAYRGPEHMGTGDL